MVTAIARPGRTFRLPRGTGSLIAVAGLVGASAALAVVVHVMGYWTLLLLAYPAMFTLVVVAPERAALVVLAAGIALEPGAIDWSGPIADALYQFPPVLRSAIPITVTPLEVLMLAIAVSLLVRGPRAGITERRPLPLLLWGVPAVVGMGLLYGLRRGAAPNLAYEELRGVIFGACVFLVARKMAFTKGRGVASAVFAGSSALALIVLGRYLFIMRDGTSGVTPEFAYAHEDAVFLAIAFIAAAALFADRNASGRVRFWLVAHNLFVLAALMTTGRRAGTLVLVVGVLTMALLYLRSRPKLVVSVGLPSLVLFGAYLGAYWNKEYGALAQPARAVRSQFDPSARDASSDQYRIDEQYDVEQTLRGNPVFGVGLGRPFAPYRPLPDLTSFWSLQWYTPHENLLWLWLWGGVTGISCFLGLWVIAFKRVLVAIRDAGTDVPPRLVVIGCSLTMYLAFARVDQALIGARSVAPLAIAIALAFSVPEGRRRQP